MAIVDNPSCVKTVCKTCLTSLGEGLHPDDSGMRWDGFHFVSIVMDKSNSNHPNMKGDGHWVPLSTIHALCK